MEQFNPKPVAEDIETKVGNLSGLNTTEKTSLVGAVNELSEQIGTLNSKIATQTVANPVTFNTTSTTSTSRVSSLSKSANVISLHIEVNMVNNSGWGVVGVVNSAYKPKHETYITVSNLAANSIKTAYIDTDGIIRIYSPGAVTYCFDITYII